MNTTTSMHGNVVGSEYLLKNNNTKTEGMLRSLDVWARNGDILDVIHVRRVHCDAAGIS